MEFAVLDPSLLYITEESWLCEEERDEYLEHLNTVINNINNQNNLSLAWNDMFDELFWSGANKLPWVQDRLWSLTIIPIIYRMMQKSSYHFDIPEETPLCEIDPDMECERDDLYHLFLKLLSTLHNNCNRLVIFLGLKNIPSQDYRFCIGDDELSPDPDLIANEVEFLGLIDVVHECWPKTQDDQSIKKGIYILLKRDYGVDVPSNEFEFSKKFIKKLISTNDDRDKILNSIAKRLSMSASAAGMDGSLQDENLSGQGERRFRVTPRPTSKRIHYKFTSGVIEFEMFYDTGEHDDGL